MRINVHAGHNPDGKVGCGAIGILRESTENRRVKDEVIRLLRALGHTAYDCTVDNGTSANNVLTNIIKKCNANEVDLDVSIHFNSNAKDPNGNGKTTGVEVLVYSETSKAVPYAQSVAQAISALGFRNRGVDVNSSLYVLRNTYAPAMIVECCFVDDKDDVALYDYQEMAEAIVYGITGQRYEEPTNNDVDSDIDSKAEEAEGDKDALYRVQVGAYRNKANADAMQKKLIEARFEACVVRG